MVERKKRKKGEIVTRRQRDIEAFQDSRLGTQSAPSKEPGNNTVTKPNANANEYLEVTKINVPEILAESQKSEPLSPVFSKVVDSYNLNSRPIEWNREHPLLISLQKDCIYSLVTDESTRRQIIHDPQITGDDVYMAIKAGLADSTWSQRILAKSR